MTNISKLDFDRELIERCQTNAPRYTSYPTADRFTFEFNQDSQIAQIKSTFDDNFNQQISLYIHIPFCNTLCLFCGCNKIITNDRSKIDTYIDYLSKEFALYANLIKRKLDVVQLHFGGGSPSWLDENQLSRIMQLINQYFNLETAKEIAMELDPRHVSDEFLSALRSHNFNRISLGLQDVHYNVQKAVNRVQSVEKTKHVLDKAKELGFESTNVDLIYGLPLQTLESYQKTIDVVLNELQPARLAIYNYAHIPNIFMPQTRINEADLPNASQKLDILQMCVQKLSTKYEFIGMDHFALPDDELAIALNNKTLQRNFQGYSTFADTHMLSFGVSAIGFIGNSYCQNVRDIDSYYRELDAERLPILRGIILNQDDIIRRDIIGQIMCQFSLDFVSNSKKHNINFNEYFAHELIALTELEQMGLLTLEADSLQVSAKGRFLIRNIAVIFDKFIQKSNNITRYSKTI